jgi:regulator of replication initiation timing
MDADMLGKLEQRVTALVDELQLQRAQNRELVAANADLNTRMDQARRRLDALIEAAEEARA